MLLSMQKIRRSSAVVVVPCGGGGRRHRRQNAVISSSNSGGGTLLRSTPTALLFSRSSSSSSQSSTFSSSLSLFHVCLLLFLMLLITSDAIDGKQQPAMAEAATNFNDANVGNNNGVVDVVDDDEVPVPEMTAKMKEANQWPRANDDDDWLDELQLEQEDYSPFTFLMLKKKNKKQQQQQKRQMSGGVFEKKDIPLPSFNLDTLAGIGLGKRSPRSPSAMAQFAAFPWRFRTSGIGSARSGSGGGSGRAAGVRATAGGGVGGHVPATMSFFNLDTLAGIGLGKKR